MILLITLRKTPISGLLWVIMGFGKDVIHVMLLRGSLYEVWQSNLIDIFQFILPYGNLCAESK
jgi:hypothetical protein